MAIRGDYLMQPMPRFVPGYDFIGAIERLPPDGHGGLSVGQRVAGILPRMGAHATVVYVAPSLLVPVPEELDSPTAATVPLDAVTARLALDALDLDDAPILVQGAGGAVGSWAVQMATARGHHVYGTASPRSHRHAEDLGATVFDYRDPDWIENLVAATDGGVAGAIDQTGSRSLRRAVTPGGRIVRIAFDGKPGHQRRATAAGFLATNLRRYARPRERICSVPMLLATRRDACRRALASALDAVVSARLVAPQAHLFPLSDYPNALAAADRGEPGMKVILTID